MKNNQLNILLKKLISNRIDGNEYDKLKSIVSISENKELEKDIKQLWKQHNSLIKIDTDTKNQILDNITNTLQSNRNRKEINWKYIAAAVLIPIIMIISYLIFNTQADTINQYLIKSEVGQKSYLLLPDSTEVWLNSGSQLIYHSDYNKKNRIVKLEGEGYFKVKHFSNKKFIVEVEKINVVVHGTTFNVSSYKNDSLTTISLEEGSVSLEDKLNNETVASLLPNQSFVLKNKTMNWEVNNTEAQLYGIWHNYKLKLVDVSVSEMLSKIERWYGVNIYCENPKQNFKYGFTVKSESLRELLDLINKITPIQYNIDGEQVYMKYK